MKNTLLHIGLSLFVTWMIAMTINTIYYSQTDREIKLIAIIIGSAITLCIGIYKEAVKDEKLSWWDMGCDLFGIGLGIIAFILCV
jgi:hypothetical protein